MKAALSVSPSPDTNEYVKVSPTSGSVVESVATTKPPEMFSAKVDAEIVILVGLALIIRVIITFGSNAKGERDVTVCGMVTLVNWLPENAPSPIDVTPSRMVTLVNWLP